MLKFVPTSLPDSVYSTLIFNVIEGENRIGQISISMYFVHGKNEAVVFDFVPKRLRFDPDIKEQANKFAQTLFEIYERVDDEDGRYWRKK